NFPLPAAGIDPPPRGPELALAGMRCDRYAGERALRRYHAGRSRFLLNLLPTVASDILAATSPATVAASPPSPLRKMPAAPHPARATVSGAANPLRSISQRSFSPGTTR